MLKANFGFALRRSSHSGEVWNSCMSCLARAKERLMMSTWWIADPRSMRARRMCHFACKPAPNTVMEWTLERMLKIMVAASAVRKAVSSSASRKA